MRDLDSRKRLTTKEAAAALGCSVRNVQKLIKGGTLPAEKMGRDWFVKENDLSRARDLKPGRRPKIA